MLKDFLKGFVKGSLYIASGYVAYYAIIAVLAAMLILGVILMIIDFKIGLVVTLLGLMAMLYVIIKFAVKLVQASAKDLKKFLCDDDTKND